MDSAICSNEQLEWSFGYAKTFTKMLIDLSIHITSSGKLQMLYDGNYKHEAKKYIVEKAIRFMRSYIANYLVKFSSCLSNTTLAILVECCLDLDDFFYSILPTYQLSITCVICDAESVLQQWMKIEHAFFIQTLLDEFKQDDVYSIKFGQDTYFHANNGSIPDFENSSMTPTRCYNGLYACFNLFIIATKRYVYLNNYAQIIFSGIVLEPLLCICIGLLLLRIRSNKSLFYTSLGSNLSHSSSILLINNKDSRLYGYPTELVDFMESVQYFQLSIGLTCGNCNISTSMKQFDRYWKRVQLWIPHRLITLYEYNNEFSAMELVKKVFNNDDILSLLNHNSTDNNKRNKVIVDEVPIKLSYSIEMARAQALTLSAVLEQMSSKMILS
jgi:hypothetical protein